MVLTYSQPPPAKEWNLKPTELDGDSLSYNDMMERSVLEERRRERERNIMQEGKALWLQKKQEQLEVELREQEDLREMAQASLFGKPGHGAPTNDIRKKKFTEYQFDQLAKQAMDSALEENDRSDRQYGGGFTENHRGGFEYGQEYEPSFMMQDQGRNPYRPPSNLMNRNLSKSEPDISPPLQIRSIRTYPVPSCEKVEQMTPAPTVPVLIETRNGRGTIEVLPDSGADICAAGFNFLYKLGENEKNLSESLISPRAVNGTKLQPVGFLRAKVYLGHRVTDVRFHIYKSICGAVLSWKAAQALGILPQDYPKQQSFFVKTTGGGDNINNNNIASNRYQNQKCPGTPDSTDSFFTADSGFEDNHFQSFSKKPAVANLTSTRRHIDSLGVRYPSVSYGRNDALTFGRPGCGAPVRTRSGRIRTTLIGNPEIRFQPNESVQKTIYNTIRYSTDPESKATYQAALEQQIADRRSRESQLKQYERAVAQELVKYEGSQWGRPGPGGPYWRDRAITGQGFFEKMGWSSSADPRRRAMDIKHLEAEDMKKEMDEIQIRKHLEHDELRSDVGVELVPLLKQQPTGNPRKDPNTGYMMSHSLSTTDVTRAQIPNRPEMPAYPRNSPTEDKKMYYAELAGQVHSKRETQYAKRSLEAEQQMHHFQHWDTFWGRPGYGAPREGKGPQKENLMKILHYPSAKSPSNVELITLERLPVHKA